MASMGRVLGYDVHLSVGEGAPVTSVTLTMTPTWRTPFAVGWFFVCRWTRKLCRRP